MVPFCSTISSKLFILISSVYSNEYDRPEQPFFFKLSLSNLSSFCEYKNLNCCSAAGDYRFNLVLKRHITC